MSVQAEGQGALVGIKVIDLSRVLGGPLCTQILADHGADVVKVEPPQGDDTRSWGPPFENGTAAYFIGINRNKHGIVLDLSREAGREVLMRLLEDADVLVENFKAGTLEKWGIGYEEVLQSRFPRLIHCRISGFGPPGPAGGPLGGFVGYDAIAQAIGGLMSVNGDERSGVTRIGVPVVDMTSGLNAVIGILLALWARAQSGKGQSVEAALFDSAVSLLHPHAANWLLRGTVPKLSGNAHPNIAPYETFETADGDVFLGIGNNAQFRMLAMLLDRSDLAEDPRFATNADRVANRAGLRAEIQQALKDSNRDDLCARLLAAGVPAGAVNTVPQTLNHPQTAARQMVVAHDGYRGVGNPVKLSQTPASVRKRPPKLGEDTKAILQRAGYSQQEIGDLMREKIAG